MDRTFTTSGGAPFRRLPAQLLQVLPSRRGELAVFCVIALIQLSTITHHTSWRDEHQAWLIALGSRTLSDLWANLRFEGHPPLWHVLLWISQQISTDLVMLKITQAVVALATLAVVVFLAPFSLALRAMLGLNYFLLFEYGAFARSYALGAFLILAALAVWRSRFAWGLLALAAFASLHFMLLAGALGLYRLVRKGVDIPGVAILGVGCLLSLFCLWPHPDTVRPIFLESAGVVVMRAILYGGVSLWPLTPLGGWFHFVPMQLAVPIALASALAIWWAALRLFRYDLVSRLLVLAFLGGMAFLAVFAYPLYPRHAGTLVLLIVGLHWLKVAAGDREEPTFRTFAAWLAVVGLAGVTAAAATNFSSAHLAAREIGRLGLQDRVWAVYPSWHSADFASINARPALNLQQGCLQTFQIWNFPVHHLLENALLVERLTKATQAAGGTLHVMSSEDLGALKTGALKVQILFTPARDQIGEVVRLYRIDVAEPDLPARPIAPPVCEAGSTRAAFARR